MRVPIGNALVSIFGSGFHVFDDEIDAYPVSFGPMLWHLVVGPNPIFSSSWIAEHCSGACAAFIHRNVFVVVSSVTRDVSSRSRKRDAPLFATGTVESIRPVVATLSPTVS